MASPFQLDDADEYMHDNTGESNFNESMYFNFFDPTQKLGGFLRIGNRVNERYAETTVCLYEPDGSVLFNFKRPEIEDNSRFEAGGIRFEVLEPFELLHIRYAGKACRLLEPLTMADPRKAFAENPFVPITVDFEIRGLARPFGGERKGGDANAHEMAFAKGHYEQHLSATGSISIDGKAFGFSGYGLRDHSWGPRSWQAPLYYRWLTANLGPDFGFAATFIATRDGGEIRGGYLHRGREIELLRHVEIETDFVGEQQVHDRIQVQLVTRSDEKIEVTGRVLSLIPLRNRREGHTTRICEGMTEWTCEGQTGYGLSEYLDQLD